MLILPIAAILFSFIVSIKATKSWFSPGSFFAISWLFFLITPMVFAPEFMINNNGIWFIALFVMSCSSGGVLASLIISKTRKIQQNRIKNNFHKLANPLFVINLISFIGIIGLIFYIDSFYLNSKTLTNWLSIPNLISIDRYSGDLAYPILVKYSLYFIYPGNIIGGIAINRKVSSILNRISCFIPLFFSIILGFIEGSRTSILLGSILFLSSWISSRAVIDNDEKKPSSYKIIIPIIFFIISFLFLFIFIQWLRQGLDPIIFDLIIIRIKAYFFGYLSAFTIWFGTLDDLLSINSLFSTFAGPMSLVGALDRNLGFYDSIIINKEVSTNIFTALRSLISDFSIIGTLFISFLIGFIFQLEFQKKRNDVYSKILFISIFYSFTLYSPLISIFHYNSIFFSWIIVFTILKLSFKL